MPIQKASISPDCSDNLRESGSENVGIALCPRRNAHATLIPHGFCQRMTLQFAMRGRDASRHALEIADIHVVVRSDFRGVTPRG
jgi:hypothetical protein